jgi:DNA (cytosine-5)-methyltransferase 1
METLREKISLIINRNISLLQTEEIYKCCVSHRQSYVAKQGKQFENEIYNILNEIPNIHIFKQVAITNDGIIIKGRKAPHIVDFIISTEENIISKHISDVIVISVKNTCRERYKQDDFTLIHKPKLYILCCKENDYPTSDNFNESEIRKIVCNTPKIKDDRTHKLSLNDLKQIIETQFQTTYMDLCCGIGSFHYAMQHIFGNTAKLILAIDILNSATNSYKANYPNTNVIKEDIKNIDFNKWKSDIIFAGVPCQSFSNIGKREGVDSKNGELLIYLLKTILPTVKPKFLVIENVKGLLTHNKGETFDLITDYIIEAGYCYVYNVISCKDYGIPQNRKRVFIICSTLELSQDDFETFLEENKIESPTLSEFLEGNFEKNIAYTIRCGGLNSPITSKQNWDGYNVDEKVYRLTLEDKKKLQGFPTDFITLGSEKEQSNLMGNTIPTNMTKLIVKYIQKIMLENRLL